MDRQTDLNRATPSSQPTSHRDDLIALEACAGLDPADVGRKASVLAWAGTQGLSTPGGWVLPASGFWAALEACGSRQQARYLAASALRLDPRHSLDLAAGIHAALGLPAAADLARAHAEAAFRRLPARPLVARSSSALEDGSMAAYPGIFTSRLDLTSSEDLADAIVACWRSAFSPIALKYLLRLQAEPIDFSLAVLIQPQVQADWYGLYVGADPVSGAPTPIVELTQQGPEALVGGAAATVRAERVDEAWSLQPATPSLAPALARVSSMAARLAARVPGPLDIEFALEAASSEPVLLQCRPVTPARMAGSSVPDGAGKPVLVGRACAPGVAAGLMLSPEQTTPSDVPRIAVVERLTIDDYALVFGHKGIVAVDEVSSLSHVAILCRELGVPLVCGVGVAANALAESWIRLDGNRGHAELLPAPLRPAVDARPQEPVLYVCDIEGKLLSWVGQRPQLPASTAPLEQELAQELGAKEARVLAVKLGSAEVQQLRVMAERLGPGLGR